MRAAWIVGAWVRDERAEEVLLVGEVFGDGYEIVGDNCCLGLEGGPFHLSVLLVDYGLFGFGEGTMREEGRWCLDW